MTLDVITIGRSSVDLYGQQIGGRLEDMRSFQKYIGGSPANMACGAARLGLRAGLITGVGDEHMGRFILEELAREGVDTRGVKIDPERLTALVLLGIRDQTQFPLIFYRENCADMGLTEADIDPDYIRQARAVVVTGTHLSHPATEAALRKAAAIARDAGITTILDIDYRPNLWGLAGHDAGAARFVESASVSARLQTNLDLFDVIVGTEEEFHVAGGTTDTLAGLRTVRDKSAATLVCKRGPIGASAFPGAIPKDFDDGVTGPGFAIEVFNVLGAGDGFMAGLLKGYLDGEPWEVSLRYANACGALAVSRHGCTPAYPSLEELNMFLQRGVTRPDLRNDPVLEDVHWATTQRRNSKGQMILRLDELAMTGNVATGKRGAIATLQRLSLQAVRQVSQTYPGCGIICDGEIGRDVIYEAAGTGLWIGRLPPVVSGQSTKTFGDKLGNNLVGEHVYKSPAPAPLSALSTLVELAEWPRDTVVVSQWRGDLSGSDGPDAMALADLQKLARAARRNALELLIDMSPLSETSADPGRHLDAIRAIYAAGVRPDWWALPAWASAQDWRQVVHDIAAADPHISGVLVCLPLGIREEDIQALDVAAEHSLVKGCIFSGGDFRTLAQAWAQGDRTEAGFVADLAATFAQAVGMWHQKRAE